MANFCWRCGRALEPDSQQCFACGALAARATELRLGLPAPAPTQAFPLDFPLPVADDLGRVMDQGWKLYRKHFWMLARINLLIWGPAFLVQNLVVYRWDLQDELALTFLASLVQAVLCGALVGPAQIYSLLSAQRTGSAPPLRLALAWGGTRWFRLVGYGALVTLLSFAGLIVFLVPGVIIWLIWVFVNEIVSVEAPGAKALARSRQLTRGIRLRLLGAACIAGLLISVCYLAVSMPFHLTNTVDRVDNWWAATLFDALGSLAYPFLSCILLVAYLDARRREAVAGRR